MKLMIASDLHGSLLYARQMKEAFAREEAARLLLLGDLLYHGPRNDLPPGYDPKGVAALLNSLKDSIFCVRGNCDAEVDQMMLSFPMMAEYAVLFWEGRTLYAIHGHQAGLPESLPLQPGDALLTGHTHVPVLRRENGIFRLNPGSLSIPKDGSAPGYLTLVGNCLTHKGLDGAVLGTLALS